MVFVLSDFFPAPTKWKLSKAMSSNLDQCLVGCPAHDVTLMSVNLYFLVKGNSPSRVFAHFCSFHSFVDNAIRFNKHDYFYYLLIGCCLVYKTSNNDVSNKLCGSSLFSLCLFRISLPTKAALPALLRTYLPRPQPTRPIAGTTAATTFGSRT